MRQLDARNLLDFREAHLVLRQATQARPVEPRTLGVARDQLDENRREGERRLVDLARLDLRVAKPAGRAEVKEVDLEPIYVKAVRIDLRPRMLTHHRGDAEDH